MVGGGLGLLFYTSDLQMLFIAAAIAGLGEGCC